MKCKVGLVQMSCDCINKNKNINKIIKFAKQAGEKSIDILCYPELALTGYDLSVFKKNQAESLECSDSMILSLLSNQARYYNMIIIIGMPIVGKKGVENSAVVINNNGNIIGHYSKTHLWALEKRCFVQGEFINTFETLFGNIGVMICYDAGFPEVARKMTLNDAKIIFTLAAWRIEDKYMWDNNLLQRALENTVFVAGVNIIGKQGNSYLFGNSKIVSPYGKIINSLSNEEALLIQEIDLNEVEQARQEIHYMKDRREELY